MTAQFLLSAITVMIVRVSLNLHLGRETSLQSRSSVLDHWSVQPGSQNWTCSHFPLIAWVFRERLLLFDISSNAASSRTPAPAPRVSLALQRWCQMAVQLSHQCGCSDGRTGLLRHISQVFMKWWVTRQLALDPPDLRGRHRSDLPQCYSVLSHLPV